MKKTYRDYEEKEQLIKRLNIISGQIDGIKKMIEEDRYCKDILIQIAAIKNAINSLNVKIKSYYEYENLMYIQNKSYYYRIITLL